MATHLYLDTNIFLQCKELRELPWSKVTPDEEIILVVPSAVLKEIDKHKYDGNTRRASRARKASSRLGALVDSPNQMEMIKDASPEVKLTLSQSETFDWARYSELDRNDSDDRIVSEAILSRDQGKTTLIVTHDNGMILRAKRFRVAYFRIPDEDEWLLPPEPDDRDRQITKLDEQITRLRQQHPQIAVEFREADDKPINELRLCVKRVRGFDKARIGQLVDAWRSTKPRNIDISSWVKLVQAWKSDQVACQCRVDYENNWRRYIAEIQEFYENVHRIIETNSRYAHVSLHIVNNGTVPANELEVDLEGFGGVGFVESHIPKEIKLPGPPVFSTDHTPVLHVEPVNVTQFSLHNVGHTEPFRWSHPYITEEGSVRGRLSFQKFRHEREQNIPIFIEIRSERSITEGRICAKVSADNLRESVNQHLGVRIEYEDLDIRHSIPTKLMPPGYG